MQKYTCKQTVDQRISLILETKEQYDKVEKAMGYGPGYLRKHKYYRFYPAGWVNSNSMSESYLNAHPIEIRSTLEITFDQIDFEEKEVIGYVANADCTGWYKKGNYKKQTYYQWTISHQQ